MGANYVAHLYDLSAPWQRAEYGSRFMGVISGEPSSALAEGATLAVRCKALHETDTPSDSYRRHGADRGMLRVDPLGGSTENARAQLRDAWELWRQTGTGAGSDGTTGDVRGLLGWLVPSQAREPYGFPAAGVFVTARVRSVTKNGVEERTLTPETWSQYRLWFCDPDTYADMTETVFDVGVVFGDSFVFGFSVGALAKARIAAAIATARATMPAHHAVTAVIVINVNGFGAEQTNSDALNATPSGGVAVTTDAKGFRLI